MPLQATSGAASYDGFGGGPAAVPNYIEDVFSTYLYTGNSTSGGTQTITNSIDLSTKGGMVWIKGRSAASNHILTDTTRGAGASATNNNALASNLTDAEDLGGSSYDFLSAFNTDGFTVKQGGTTAATRGTNYDAVTYASWTFRKQAKFFDVVTYTGDAGSNRAVAHSLGSVPGCIIVKSTSDAGTNWAVYHRSLGDNKYVRLNTTAASATAGLFPTVPTATEFYVGNFFDVNSSGVSYVAYLFAHDAGGFGLTGTDNVISCGSFTTDASANASVTLGYEPQWIMLKRTDSASNWMLMDSMRGLNYSSLVRLYADLSSAEATVAGDYVNPTATGFQLVNGPFAGLATYIYIAIRRGPMRTPTTGTSVFSPNTSSAGTGTTLTTNFPTDLQMQALRTSAVSDNTSFFDRLRGFSTTPTNETGQRLISSATDAETSPANQTRYFTNTGFQIPSNWGGSSVIYWNFRRAPGFFDEVCYTGTGSARTVTHNLGVAPELMIIKVRNNTSSWFVWGGNMPITNSMFLNQTQESLDSAPYFNDTLPTASVFSVSSAANFNGETLVAYLFASCPGVSKVGSYTGTGALQTINCGFTGGARFVLIKRTDSTGDWWVYDSARGMSSGNDPYLFLNSTDAEVTGTNYVDTTSVGFQVTAAAPAGLNANGGTYIFLAIA